ncbi:hypothetical protein [Anabaena azotica]|uniref:Uncharacterized protein n=1 Tax=Anabaena azotica FACHB-119 TaxID=947527 RepID=A0ABR8D469_9NOST|nr:hypothetical protein [Anabaena azotica]MBD2501984.1 hypothetical protein [Anabaena azotica FACHB-119]
MAFAAFGLDKYAHDLVFQYRNDDRETINQVHKMRATVAYGLERFWGEQLRLEGRKAQYWADTWTKLVHIMAEADMTIPNHDDVETMANALWDSQIFSIAHRKVTLAILTQLCDCMVWWTQRYKPTANIGNNSGDDDE